VLSGEKFMEKLFENFIAALIAMGFAPGSASN
jgi:hypothetical protein